jgi:predicted nucleic acid-binding protein
MSLVIIDTSIWIEYLRGADAELGVRIEKLIHSDEAIITGLILGELLCGARDNDEFVTLGRVLDGLHCLTDDKEVYREAANLAWQLRAQGIRVPLSDLSIAAQSLRSGAPIMTRDGHFQLIESALGKELVWKA